jgi:uncharacterized protein YjiS (DUF1127 family)
MHAKTLNAPCPAQRGYRPRPLAALAWRAMAAWYVQARRRRVAACELRAMGELELKDLGVGLGEVDHLLRQPAARRRG